MSLFINNIVQWTSGQFLKSTVLAFLCFYMFANKIIQYVWKSNCFVGLTCINDSVRNDTYEKFNFPLGLIKFSIYLSISNMSVTKSYSLCVNVVISRPSEWILPDFPICKS